jgi:hypothetical protein
MTESTERTIERLEEQLEGAERTLSSLRPLDEEQARRVAERMDRLHSQLLAVSKPPGLMQAHERMGTEPVGADEFDALAEEMGPPDGED